MDLLGLYDRQLRLRVPARVPEGWAYEFDGPLLRVSGGERGFVEGPPDLPEEGLDALIARQRDFFGRRGEAVEWKTRGHDRPADLTVRLERHGFRPEEPETVLVAEAAALAAPGPAPEGVRLRRAEEPGDLARIAAMESRVWGRDMGWLADDLAARRQELTILVAEGAEGADGEAAGEVVSAAWLAGKDGTDFACLWGGSTLTEWRGRGIYRALVAERARLAHADGVRFLEVDASADSRPILERLGFTALTTTTPYVWAPGDD